MTIKDVLAPLPTLDQYEVLQRADVRFAFKDSEFLGPNFLSGAGRYYAGPLAPEDVDYLTPKKPERQNRT